jgi:hypothetical protein
MRTAEQTGAAPHAGRPAVANIVGSTRPGRKADTVAHWAHDIPADGGRVDLTLRDALASRP